MPTQITGAVNRELRSAGYVAGGLAATTTVKTAGFPTGTRNLYLSCHNLSSATVVEYTLNPWLTVLKTTDSGATFTDYSVEAQNDSADADITLSSLDTVANGEALFIGATVPFRGLQFDLEDLNDTASVLTISYYNGTTWADTSNSDGTDVGGDTFKQDGANTWTINSAWVSEQFRNIMAKDNEPFKPTYVQPAGAREHVSSLYWVRLEVSAALDSSTTASSIHALNRSERYAQLVLNQNHNQALKTGFGGFGSLEYSTDAGTADLVANVGSGDGYFG